MIVYAGKRPQAIRAWCCGNRPPFARLGIGTVVSDRLSYDAQGTRKAPSDEGAVAVGD